MTAVLPTGLTFRRPSKDDAGAIYELVGAYNTAIVGWPDFTFDDMVDELSEPGFDLDQDGWLVFAGETLSGYGTVFGQDDHELLDIDVYAADRAVADWLLARVIARAQEMAGSHGQSEVMLDTGTYRDDLAKRELLADNGFAAGTTYHRMRIDHAGPVSPPEVPEGVVVRRGATDEATRRVLHEVFTESFTGQFGFTARSYEDWFTARESKSTFDWAKVTLLEVDGRAVAFLEDTNEFIEDENCNYVSRLGVLESARGRGLAKFLLRDAFAAGAAAGRTGTILHVDTNNPTPALGLYLSVGMQPTLVIDVWRRTLQVG